MRRPSQGTAATTTSQQILADRGYQQRAVGDRTVPLADRLISLSRLRVLPWNLPFAGVQARQQAQVTASYGLQ